VKPVVGAMKDRWKMKEPGSHKLNPIVLSMGVEVYKNNEGKYVVNTAVLKQKVETMLRRRGLIE